MYLLLALEAHNENDRETKMYLRASLISKEKSNEYPLTCRSFAPLKL